MTVIITIYVAFIWYSVFINNLQMTVLVICKYYGILYERLEYLWVLVSAEEPGKGEIGSWNNPTRISREDHTFHSEDINTC